MVTSSGIDPGGARVATKTGGTTLGFVLADLHANLAGLTNSAETSILSALRYDPFGQTIGTPYDSGGSFPTPWKFQGRLDVSPDASDSLYATGARFYSPGIGAFIELDSYHGSAADPLTLNRYLYAEANPWTLSDPTGHCVEAVDGGGCVSISTAMQQMPAPDSSDDTLENQHGLHSPPYAPSQNTCSAAMLNCTSLDFDAWSATQRTAWLTQLAQLNGRDQWFNAVDDVLKYAEGKGWLASGSWFSVVDSQILLAIEQGVLRSKGLQVANAVPGSSIWAAFWNPLLHTEVNEAELLGYWGKAEQAATRYGVQFAAEKRHLEPTPTQGLFLLAGNFWRSAVASRGLTDNLEYSPELPGIFAHLTDPIFDPRSHGVVPFLSEFVYEPTNWLDALNQTISRSISCTYDIFAPIC